jgi:hypothetical protein
MCSLQDVFTQCVPRTYIAATCKFGWRDSCIPQRVPWGVKQHRALPRARGVSQRKRPTGLCLDKTCQQTMTKRIVQGHDSAQHRKCDSGSHMCAGDADHDTTVQNVVRGHLGD